MEEGKQTFVSANGVERSSDHLWLQFGQVFRACQYRSMMLWRMEEKGVTPIPDAIWHQFYEQI